MNKKSVISQITERYVHPGKEGDKLPPERKISEELNISHGRIHQAILTLEKNGILKILPRFGIFIAEKKENSFMQKAEAETKPGKILHFLPQAFSPLPLKLSIPFGKNSHVSNVWTEILNGFAQSFPYFSMSIDYSYSPENEENIDFQIRCPAAIIPEKDLPLSDTELFQKQTLSGLIPSIEECARLNGEIYGMPLLHTFAAWFGNKKLLAGGKNCPLSWSSPWDFFDAGLSARGHLPEKQCMDFDFRGFIYHAAPFGIELVRDGNEVSFDEEKTREFLVRLKPYLQQRHFNHMLSDNRYQEFEDGKIAVFCDYTSMMHCVGGPLQFLGFPLTENGFACQNAYLGKIGRNSSQKNNVLFLLEYLLREEIQRQLTEKLPGYFSVRNSLFQEQKAHLKKQYPHLSPDFMEFNIRGYHSLLDHQIYFHHGNKVNFEIVKYVMGMQNLTRTISAMHKLD